MKKLYKKALAFTLAEILVALTIIGVVSALTIPNLMRNTQAAQSKTAFKKSIASLNQAIAEYISENGTNLAQAEVYRVVEAEQVKFKGTLYNIYEEYLKAKETSPWDVTVHLGLPTLGNNSNTRNVEIPNAANYQTGILKDQFQINYAYYQLPDGTSLIVPRTLNGCGRPHVWTFGQITTNSEAQNQYKFTDKGNYGCLGYIDINGRKGPNQSLIGVSSDAGSSDACAYVIRPGENYMVTNSSKEYCKLTDNAITDIYPIVFFNDKVYPATVAGYWVLNDLVGEQLADADSVITPPSEPPTVPPVNPWVHLLDVQQEQHDPHQTMDD